MRPNAGLASAYSLGRERVVERAFGRGSLASGAQHVDQGTQRGRHLSMARIIEEKPLEGRRPVLQHANQLPGAQERVGDSLDRVGDSQAVDGGANR